MRNDKRIMYPRIFSDFLPSGGEKCINIFFWRGGGVLTNELEIDRKAMKKRQTPTFVRKFRKFHNIEKERNFDEISVSW